MRELSCRQEAGRGRTAKQNMPTAEQERRRNSGCVETQGPTVCRAALRGDRWEGVKARTQHLLPAHPLAPGPRDRDSGRATDMQPVSSQGRGSSRRQLLEAEAFPAQGLDGAKPGRAGWWRSLASTVLVECSAPG